MVFIPPFLHPLSTANSLPPVSPLSFTPSHLPPTMDSFLHSPTYYHAVLPLPYIIFLDLLPFGQQIFQSLRLANQRTELPSSRGEILSVDVWIHEAAFTIGGGAAEGGGGWGAGGAGGGEGMEVGPWAGTTVILESDGTKEVSTAFISFYLNTTVRSFVQTKTAKISSLELTPSFVFRSVHTGQRRSPLSDFRTTRNQATVGDIGLEVYEGKCLVEVRIVLFASFRFVSTRADLPPFLRSETDS